MKRSTRFMMLLCLMFVVLLPLSTHAQPERNRNIRVQPVNGTPPNRRNPPTPTPRPSTGGIGTTSSALGSCDEKVYNEGLDSVVAQGFSPNAWVLVIVPDGDSQVTFWWKADANGAVFIDRLSALLPGAAFADLYDTLLVGQNGPILGHCANVVEESPQSLYRSYRDINPIPLEITQAIFDAASSPFGSAVIAAQEVDPSAIIGRLEIDDIIAGGDLITETDVTPDPNIPVNEGFLQSSIGVSNAVSNSGGDLWNFSANAGDVVSISAVSEQFDTYLTLYDSNLNVLYEDDDSLGNLDSLISNYVLPTTGDYVVNVRAFDRVATGGYTLFLEISAPPPTPTLVSIPSTIECGGYTTRLTRGGQAQRSRGNNVRIRSNPSRSAQQIGTINSNTAVAVLDGPQCVDNVPWWQVNYNGVIGWAAEAADGLTLLVPVGSAPPANNPPAGNTGNVPTIVPTVPFVPTNPPVFIPTEVPPAPAGTLNYGASPNYGTVDLVSGFSPDPYPVGITSGGSVDVAYLGCVGYATFAPDFRLYYTGGSFPLLRIYFIGSGDTTLIINDPGGGWHCIDDSYGTTNPSLDFSSPMSGQYDIWVGSYSAGVNVGGTLYITELDGNHP